jgi:HEAT repeat protein
LEEEIGGQDLYFRPVAVRTLASLGPDGIPHLIDALEHEAPDVRQAAAEALYEMALGPQDTMPKATVPALVKALEDKVEGVRYYAAMTLLHIDPEEAKKETLKDSLLSMA